jgi:hypothetical protein
MLGLVLGLQEQIRQELMLPRYLDLYFYRDHPKSNGCGCYEYYKRLDACPLRMPHDKQHGEPRGPT